MSDSYSLSDREVLALGDPVSRRGRGGRPRKNPEDVRGMAISVRVSAHELIELQSRAAQMGITPREWMRRASLDRRLPSPPVPRVNVTEYVRLSRLGSVLNQLARAANSGELVQVDQRLLEEVRNEVRALQLKLIGGADDCKID